MLVTKDWIKEKYDYFNKLIFNSNLPSNIEFKINNSTKRWGYAQCNFKKIYDGYVAVNLSITLSNYYDSSELVKENTLIHEMIHIDDFVNHLYHYISNDGRKRKYDCHGYWFLSECNRIKEFGYDITKYVSEEEKSQSNISDDNLSKLNKKKENGSLFFIVKLNRNESYYKDYNGKYNVGFAKFNEKDLNKITDWLSMHANQYIDNMDIYKSFSIEGAKMRCKNNGGWWYATNEDFVIKKYELQFLRSLPLFNHSENKNISNNNNINNDTIPLFKINFTNGKSIELKNTNINSIKDKLKKLMPHFNDETIDKIVNNDKFYPIGKKKLIDENYLINIIKESIRKNLNLINNTNINNVINDFDNDPMVKLNKSDESNIQITVI